MKEKSVQLLYAEWRQASEILIREGQTLSIDCGIQTVREDFSSFCEMDNTISFEEMHQLELEYEKKY